VGVSTPFLYEVTLDRDLALYSPWNGVSVLVDDFDGNAWKNLSYGFDSLDD